MGDSSLRVLAISPGARHTGVATLERGSLVRFSVFAAERYAARGALTSMIRGPLDADAPDIAVIEAATSRRDSAAIADVVRAAKRACSEAGVRIARRPLAPARRLVAEPDRPTRRAAHNALARIFPALGPLTRQRDSPKWWADVDRYWERAFAALALCVECAHSLHGAAAPPKGAGRKRSPQALRARDGTRN